MTDDVLFSPHLQTGHHNGAAAARRLVVSQFDHRGNRHEFKADVRLDGAVTAYFIDFYA